MNWDQIFVIAGINVALVGTLITVVVWVLNKVDSDVKSIGNRMDSEMRTMNSRMDKFEARMDGHASRIDQLYKMFVDLLKERK